MFIALVVSVCIAQTNSIVTSDTEVYTKEMLCIKSQDKNIPECKEVKPTEDAIDVSGVIGQM